MDYGNVIFWLVCLSAITGLVVALTRLRSVGAGWVVLYLAIHVVAVIGRLRQENGWTNTALGMWLLLALLPGLIARIQYRLVFQQRYAAACRVARVISWLHPADGLRQQPEMLRALERAQRGELSAALETLQRFEKIESVIGLVAMINLFRLMNRWEELIAWQGRHGQHLERYPQLLPTLLRAQGETGDLRGLAELYDRNQHQIAKLIPAASCDLCRLVLFAFCGKRELAERLLGGSLAILPAPTREFWLATADVTAGAVESGTRKLEQLLPAADPPMRLAIEWRLSRSSTPPKPPDDFAEGVIAKAILDQGHDESFGARPSLFSRQARATQILIALNVLMFAWEIYLGGATNPEVLYRLGALFPPAVRAGEWWRLAASLFLHWGMPHLAMNMFALWILGPFPELALGFRNFLLVYLLAGIGSMGMVMELAVGPNAEQMTAGASGCVMGLVGATAALMLRGWWREKAMSARRRLLAMLIIVAMQTAFDALVPQVSMTAHLSGTAIGFAAVMVLPDRLRRSETRDPKAERNPKPEIRNPQQIQKDGNA
jgi:rhomboid protease GluP